MIIVTITREQLTEARACPEGVALFDAIKKHQDEVRACSGKPRRKSLRIVWSRLAQVWMASAYPWAWGWARDMGILPAVPLTGADLRGADLSDADLYGANLYGANLYGANLRDADLSGANLSDADLSGANLRDANLGGADLSGAYLGDADLSGADPETLKKRGAVFDDSTDPKLDLWSVLDLSPAEVPALRDALRAGTVNGSVYQGECACLVGTLANARGCDYSAIPGLVPNANRPAERWFLSIRPGRTPQNSSKVRRTVEWIEEWSANRQKAAP